MKTHDFERSREAEERLLRDDRVLLLLYQFFPESDSHQLASLQQNRSGFDMSVSVPHGPDITIDWKCRWPGPRGELWNDIALEFAHQRDNGNVSPGWAADANKQCDLFAYLFSWDFECWLLPKEATQQAWLRNEAAWREKYKRIEARNPSWTSLSYAIPLPVIRSEIAGIRIATPTSLVEPALGYDEKGRFLHYCHCGRWGSFGLHASLRNDRLGTWYCDQHKPKEYSDADQ